MRNGILDEQFFRRAYEPTLLRDWVAAKPLIDDMRRPNDPRQSGNPGYFEHYEWLVKRWESRSLWARFRNRR
jgi:hypothetical protein